MFHECAFRILYLIALVCSIYLNIQSCLFFFPVPYRRVKERWLSVLGHLLHFIVLKHMRQYYKGDKHIRKTLTH